MRKINMHVLNNKAVVLSILALLGLSACQTVDVEKGVLITEKGVNMEAFLPENPVFLLKVGTKDQQQIDGIKKLNELFPDDPLGMMVEEFNVGFQEEADLEELGLDYEKDLLPILGEKSELIIAMEMNAENVEDLENGFRGVAMLTVNDQEKTDTLLVKLLDQDYLKEDVYQDQKYYFVEEDGERVSYIMRDKDLLLLASNLEYLQNGIDSLKDQSTKATSGKFKQYLEQTDGNVAFAYIDFQKILGMMEKIDDAEVESLMDLLKSTNTSGMSIMDLESEVYYLTVENEGLKLRVDVNSGEEVDWDKIKSKLAKSYLYKELPADHLLAYFESFNLVASYDNFVSVAEYDEDLKAELAEADDFLSAQGLSLEDDILPVFSKGIAFVMDYDDSLVPSIGIYVDATGGLAGAEKLAVKMDEFFEGAWQEMLVENPDIESLVKKETVIEDKLWKFSANFDVLLFDAPAVLSKKFSGRQYELYYGLAADKYLVLSLRTDLLDQIENGNRVGNDQLLRDAMSAANAGDTYGLTYLGIGEFMGYLDKFIDLAIEVGMPTDDLLEYEEAKLYIEPFKSVTLYSKVDEARNTMSMEMFVHVAE